MIFLIVIKFINNKKSLWDRNPNLIYKIGVFINSELI